jgi:hypothetical protein
MPSTMWMWLLWTGQNVAREFLNQPSKINYSHERIPETKFQASSLGYSNRQLRKMSRCPDIIGVAVACIEICGVIITVQKGTSSCWSTTRRKYCWMNIEIHVGYWRVIYCDSEITRVSNVGRPTPVIWFTPYFHVHLMLSPLHLHKFLIPSILSCLWGFCRFILLFSFVSYFSISPSWCSYFLYVWVLRIFVEYALYSARARARLSQSTIAAAT